MMRASPRMSYCERLHLENLATQYGDADAVRALMAELDAAVDAEKLLREVLANLLKAHPEMSEAASRVLAAGSGGSTEKKS